MRHTGLIHLLVILAEVLDVTKSNELSLEDVLHRIDQVDTKLMTDILYLRRALAKEVKERKRLEERLNLCRACADPIPENSTSGSTTENTVNETKLNQIIDQKLEILTDAFEAEKNERIALKAKVDILQEKMQNETTELKHDLQQNNLQSERTSVENFRKIQYAVCKNIGNYDCLEGNISSLECCFETWTDQLISSISNNSIALNALRSETETVKRVLEHSLDDVRDSITQTADELVGRLAPVRVSFYARVGPAIPNVSPWATVVFRSVVTNDGNSYDRNTGIFSAPANGTYAFFVTIMSKKYQEFVLKARAKDSKIQNKPSGNDLMWVFTSETKLNSGSNMAVLRLKEGDTVRVVKYGPWGTKPHYVHHAWSTFSGFLLYADK